MKRTFQLFSFLLLEIYLFSCTSLSTPEPLPELVRAESLMYDHPDSALMLLDSMAPPSEPYQNALWSLLVVQARDKNYIKHTSDSLINVAYDYFIRRDDPHRRALVLNYEGVVNESLGEMEKATEFYLRAGDEVLKTEDYDLGNLIYSNLGMVYAYRSLNEECLFAFQKAYELAKLSKDNYIIAFSLIYLGRIYGVLEQWEQSIEFYKQAIIASESIKDKHDRSLGSALGELGEIYYQIDKPQEALIYLKRAETEKRKNGRDLAQTYLALGKNYSEIEQYDSAYLYLNQALITENIYTKQESYYCLYSLCRDRKKYEKAIIYNEKYLQYRDSVEQLNRTNAIVEVQAKYDHQKLENEKLALELDKSRLLRSSLVSLSVLLLVIALLIYIYQRRILKKERTIQKDKALLLQYTRQLNENEQLIKRNQERIVELSGEISAYTELEESMKEQTAEMEHLHVQNRKLLATNDSLQQHIDQYVILLQQRDSELDDYEKLSAENLQLRDRESFLCEQLTKHIPLLRSLRITPHYLATQGEREEILDMMNTLYENFTVRLSKLYPALTEEDLLICCLVKLHLNNGTIAALFAISPASVVKRKQRIRERMAWKTEINGSLDLWLQRY